MPIYEYQCDKCGEVVEVLQKLNDPPPKRHSCGSRKLHRLISRSSFILKGTGWYVTDYARKDKGENGSTKSKKKGADKDTGKASESGTGKASESGTGKASESGTGKASESGTGKAETASASAKVA